MKNSQTTKPPVTVTMHRSVFWLSVGASIAILITFFMYLYLVILPANLHAKVSRLEDETKSLFSENSNLKNKNDDLLIKSGSLQQILESEQMKVAELQAQATIVEKIKKESLEEIAKYNKKYTDQTKQIEFYEELMRPAVDQELQCFNVNAKYSKKYVDYGINLVLDEKSETGQKYNIEFRLLSGKNNVDLTQTLPEDLAPDIIRKISIKNSIRLTGKIKHNNKLKGLKVLDVRVYNASKKLAAQCWKVF